MRSLEHHASIAKHLAALNARINALADIYANYEARNPADDALIGILNGHAQQMLAASAALTAIEYQPPAPPSTVGGEGDPGDETA
jgi:hypothetical protein